MKILKKLNILLDKKQKRKMAGLLVLMIIGAILETASIGLVIPVVELVITPNAIAKNAYMSSIYDFFSFQSTLQFTVVIMLLLILAFIVKNLFLFLQQKVLYHFVYSNQFSTSERMMKNYMKKGYEFYLNADTAEIQRNITSDVNNMYSLILSLLQLTAELIIFVTLSLVLLVADAQMTLIIGGILVVTLLVIKQVIKPIMYRTGEANQHSYSGLFKWISQTVTGIKEIKIAGKEQYFIGEYMKCGRSFVDAVQKYTLYSGVPKLLIETVCMTGMIFYMLYLTMSGEEVTNMLPILSAFAVAAMRLMPCANRINNQLTQIAFFEPFFMGVSDNLQEEINGENIDISFADEPEQKMTIHKQITLQDITYAYPNTEINILENATMEIPIGAAAGIVGTSGSGKTTLVDLLLGLLEMQKGMILADGIDVKTNYRAWLQNIGYIPQMIFMLDDTIRRNVAFGIPEEKVNENRIWEVLKEAQLDGFVKGLPEGLETSIGERGIRLSGGQRQRIGIARALYEDPEVLILDEATSALDNDTEAAIMESINYLRGRKTLVIIAHRLQTIEKCDMVYRVEGGKVRKEVKNLT